MLIEQPIQLLGRLEWSASRPNMEEACPDCDRGRPEGHHPACELAAILSRLRSASLPPTQAAPSQAMTIRAVHPGPWVVREETFSVLGAAYWRNLRIHDARERTVLDLSGPDPGDHKLATARWLTALANAAFDSISASP